MRFEVQCFSCHRAMEPMKKTRWASTTNWWCHGCGHGVIIRVAQPAEAPRRVGLMHRIAGRILGT